VRPLKINISPQKSSVLTEGGSDSGRRLVMVEQLFVKVLSIESILIENTVENMKNTISELTRGFRSDTNVVKGAATIPNTNFQ